MAEEIKEQINTNLDMKADQPSSNDSENDLNAIDQEADSILKEIETQTKEVLESSDETIDESDNDNQEQEDKTDSLIPIVAEEIPLINIEKYLLRWQQLTEMLYERFNKKTITVLALNICGYENQDAIKDRLLLQRHNDIVFPTIELYEGTIIRSSGDMVVASFFVAEQCVKASIDIQVKINEYNVSTRYDTKLKPIQIKIGINTGNAMIDGDTLYGDVIRDAAVIQSQVMDEEIFISGTVHEQIKDIQDIACEFYKKVRLKGKRKTIDIYDVIWPRVAYEEIIPEGLDTGDNLQSNQELPMSFMSSWLMLAAIQATILILYLILKQ